MPFLKLFDRTFLVLTLIATLATLLAGQVPFIYTIQAAPGDNAYLVNFFSRESNASGEYWRWSKADSEIVFHNAGQLFPADRPVILSLTVASARPADQDLPIVSLVLRGARDQPLASAPAAAAITTYELPLDPRPAGGGDWTLAIHTDTFQPKGDGRALGILLKRATLRMQDPSLPILPQFSTALYAILSPLLLFLFTREIFKSAARIFFGVALAETLLLAAGLALWREMTVFYLPFIFFASLALAAFPFLLHLRVRWVQATRRRVIQSVGLAFLIGGEAVIWVWNQTTVSAVLLLAGAVILFITLRGDANKDTAQTAGANPIARWEWFALGAITLLALVLRVYRLDDIFFGLHRDETRFGLLALRVLTDPGYRPIYEGMPINQSGVFLYLLAATFQVFGVSIFSLRLVSAVAGALVVPVTWWLAREWFNDARLALVAAFGLAIATLQIYYSRVAWPLTESPLLAIPAYIFLARGLQQGKVRDYALAGFFLALAQYFSQLSRVAFLVVAFLVLDDILRRRALPRNWLRGLVGAGLIALIVLAPLLNFALQKPAVFFARTDQVAIWTDSFSLGEYVPQLLWENVLAYAGMFNTAGDTHGGRTLPARPEADPFFGVLFVVGVVVALARGREPNARRVLIWYFLTLVPGLVTLEAPAPTRVLEALSPLMILAGWGALRVGEVIPFSSPTQRARVERGMLAAICLAALAVNVFVYFGDTATDPRLLRTNQAISAALGRTLGAWRAQNQISAQALVYAPDWLITSDDRDVLEFTTNHSLGFKSLTQASPPLASNTLLILPNDIGFAKIIVQRDPRAQGLIPVAEEQDRAALAQIQALLGAPTSTVIPGENFPATNEPAFWIYIVP